MLRYDLALDIQLDRPRFRGTVTIAGLPPGDPIELDAVELAVHSARSGGSVVPFRSEPLRERLVLEPRAPLSEPVVIEYSGRVAQDLQTGLFRSRLGSHPTFTTHLEPLGARRVLPCLDRPDRKAEFRVQVTTARGLTVISNSPGSVEVAPDGRATWTFARTPPMSTYLLYIGVGPFEESRDRSVAPEIVIAGPPGSAPRTAHGLSVARAAVRALSEYYELPYPLPKLHLVALSDFWVAMENWGAISGAESHYLITEEMPPAARRFADQTIVHEIAHQWFGDLVTLSSWADLWLNEAFATFVTPRVEERARILEDPWEEFVLFSARGDPADSLEATHPVKPESLDPKEMMAASDMVTYFKGSRLIRMIERYVGEEPFRRGVSSYLRRHQFGNASSEDLWQALEESSGRGVVGVMRAWVERPGHPVIEVAQAGPDVVLSQRRFTYLARESADDPWPIPLEIARGSSRSRVLFDQREMTLAGTDATTLVLDPGRTGFFRILWEPKLRRGAIDRVRTASPIDRWGFVHDARAFLISGDFSLDEFLQVLRASEGATDLVTIDEVSQCLHGLGPMLHDEPRFVSAAREFCRAQTARLGDAPRAGEPEADDVAREEMTWARVRFDEEYSQALASRFPEVDRAPPSLRPAITVAYGREGSPGYLDALMARASGENSVAAREACWALQMVRDPDDIGRFLDFGRDSVRIGQFFASLLWAVARNPIGRPVLWPWLCANLRDLERRAEGTYLLPYMLDGILPVLGMEREPDVRAYFERERFPSAEMGIRTGLETLRAVVRMRARVVDGTGGPATSPD